MSKDTRKRYEKVKNRTKERLNAMRLENQAREIVKGVNKQKAITIPGQSKSGKETISISSNNQEVRSICRKKKYGLGDAYSSNANFLRELPNRLSRYTYKAINLNIRFDRGGGEMTGLSHSDSDKKWREEDRRNDFNKQNNEQVKILFIKALYLLKAEIGSDRTFSRKELDREARNIENDLGVLPY